MTLRLVLVSCPLLIALFAATLLITGSEFLAIAAISLVGLFGGDPLERAIARYWPPPPRDELPPPGDRPPFVD
jgi:hypothetical protein